MALVEVVGVDVEAEGAQNPNAAEAEDDLLLHPVGIVASVEVVRQRPVRLAVLLQIGVEQQDRNLVAVGRGMDVQPGTDPHLSSLDGHCDRRVERRAPERRIPPVGELALASLGIDLLAEIAGSADQRHEDHVESEVGRRAGGIAGQDAEAARVGVHLRADG